MSHSPCEDFHEPEDKDATFFESTSLAGRPRSFISIVLMFLVPNTLDYA